MHLHKIAATTDIPADEARGFDVDGRRIAVFNADAIFYTPDDECTHQGGPLSPSSPNGSCVTCLWHGAGFDVRTGKVRTPPATGDTKSYKVAGSHGDITVEVE